MIKGAELDLLMDLETHQETWPRSVSITCHMALLT